MNAADKLLDTVDWQKLPAPTEIGPDELYATHTGTLDIAGHKLRCYILSNGQRILDADDVQSFLGLK